MDVSPQVVAAVGTALTAILGVLVGRKTANGRVDKTEASELWKESAAIRRELQEQIRQLREEINAKDARIAHLEDQLRARDREILDLRAQLMRIQDDMADMRRGTTA
jgi:septal ring factor EnvC (AmiA/AmiB activator)